MPIKSPISECNNCYSKIEHKIFLHHVRHGSKHQILCTTCVLKLHPGSFCPICFDTLTDKLPPLHCRIICQKCPSITHPNCVPDVIRATKSSSYVCPPCEGGSGFSFFDEVMRGKVIDREAAKVLLCAAEIAAASMSKAVMICRLEAEMKAKEAAVCRRRAREALDRVFSLKAEEKEKGLVLRNGVEDKIMQSSERKS